MVSLQQRFPNFFQVGTTFISQNVLRTTLLLSPLLFEILNYSVWYAIHVNFIFSVFFWTNVQPKRTTSAEPEDHLWSADHSLGNAGLQYVRVYCKNLVCSMPMSWGHAGGVEGNRHSFLTSALDGGEFWLLWSIFIESDSMRSWIA
jgi:hypothetical protein